MIEDVPGHSANEVTWRPADATARSSRRHLPAGRQAQRAQDCLPGLLELFAQIVRIVLLKLPANLRQIARVPAQHMLEDAFHVAATATGSLAKRLPGGGPRGGIERPPAGLQQPLAAPKLGVAQGLRVAGWGEIGRAEIGRRVPHKPLDHDERRRLGRRLKAEPCRAENVRVAGPVVDQRLQC